MRRDLIYPVFALILIILGGAAIVTVLVAVAPTPDPPTTHPVWPNYRITYDLNYEGAPEPETITVGGEFPMAYLPPEREGYLFMGWYIDPECWVMYDENLPPTGDITLYARWANNVVGRREPWKPPEIPGKPI